MAVLTVIVGSAGIAVATSSAAGTGGDWVQLGGDIDGEPGSEAGLSVALNADGTRVIVGARSGDVDGPFGPFEAGHARVFDYDAATATWTQVGDNLDGANFRDWFGHSVAISDDGSRVIVGAVAVLSYLPPSRPRTNTGYARAYEYDEATSSWNQLGADLPGDYVGDATGQDVEMSADGSRIAVGSNDGVNVYEYDDTTAQWNQLGGELLSAVFEHFGARLAMNSAGSRLAVAATGHDASVGFTDTGQVRIFDFDAASSQWVQLPATIDGRVTDENLGWDVAISDDGQRVAVGVRTPGQIRVFDYDGASSMWNQVGSDLETGTVVEPFGRAVRLSGDGSRLIAGAPNNAIAPGFARAYEYDDASADWVPLGSDLVGAATGDAFGQSVGLNDDGSTVAVGGYIHNSFTGHVRVYDFGLDTTVPVSLTPDECATLENAAPLFGYTDAADLVRSTFPLVLTWVQSRAPADLAPGEPCELPVVLSTTELATLQELAAQLGLSEGDAAAASAGFIVAILRLFGFP